MELQNKVVIVTGAGSGIGRAIAILLANEGAQVSVVDFVDKIGAESVEMIKKGGGTAKFIHADVSKASDAQNSVKATVDAFGRLDVLVNNAGIERAGSVVDLPERDWDMVLGVNLKGVFLMSKYAVPELAKSHGTIVNTGSTAAFTSYRGSTAYAASKAGVISLTRTMAIDHAGDGIRVNCVCPGAIDTALHQKYVAELDAAIRDDYVKQQIADHPIGRIGKPEEIANAVLFLASPRSSYMTGAALVVDGGFLAK
jgi:NAD(P)-dependent dehydrogenase (short-subunit alcohol dehydrogenase family)